MSRTPPYTSPPAQRERGREGERERESERERERERGREGGRVCFVDRYEKGTVKDLNLLALL